MRLDEIEAYQLYLAVKLHFTSDSYDFFENRGRVKNTRFDNLLSKSYYPVIRKMSSTMTATEIRDYCIANMLVGGGSHIFDIDSTGKRIYLAYLKRKSARKRVFESDLTMLVNDMQKKGAKSFSDAFKIPSSGEYPYLLLMYLGGHVSVETLCILRSLNTACSGYLDEWSSTISDPFVFPDAKRQIEKMTPFVMIKDYVPFNEILDRVTQSFKNG